MREIGRRWLLKKQLAAIYRMAKAKRGGMQGLAGKTCRRIDRRGRPIGQPLAPLAGRFTIDRVADQRVAARGDDSRLSPVCRPG